LKKYELNMRVATLFNYVATAEEKTYADFSGKIMGRKYSRAEFMTTGTTVAQAGDR
jgi:hypothetical protein